MAVEVKKSAFPTGNVLDSGMTLMDYFAGQWLSGLAHGNDQTLMTDHERESLAEFCYTMANSMMEERRKW